MNAGRIDALRAELDGLDAQTFLVSSPINVSYLTGFESSNAAVLVGRDGVRLVTDGRYINAARQLDGGIEVVEGERELPTWLAAHLGEVAEPPVAFEANTVTYAAYESIASAGLEMRPARAVIERLRAVKDGEELDAIRRAARVLNEVYERLAEHEMVGSTEAELAWWVEQALHEAGSDAIAFDVIVGSGPNAARPHHHPGERTIAGGETVIVDAGARVGARVGGYCSDCTRTFATGPLPDELRRAYDVCLHAQETALVAVRAGADARELDAAARREIEATRIAEVQHGLGHGVGLEIHELPRLSPASDATLAPGNVVTVEPGVYLAGIGGVRIEDLVIVTHDGPEVLTPFTKELVTVG